jgi:hypothetical protein
MEADCFVLDQIYHGTGIEVIRIAPGLLFDILRCEGKVPGVRSQVSGNALSLVQVVFRKPETDTRDLIPETRDLIPETWYLTPDT